MFLYHNFYFFKLLFVVFNRSSENILHVLVLRIYIEKYLSEGRIIWLFSSRRVCNKFWRNQNKSSINYPIKFVHIYLFIIKYTFINVTFYISYLFGWVWISDYNVPHQSAETAYLSTFWVLLDILNKRGDLVHLRGTLNGFGSSNSFEFTWIFKIIYRNIINCFHLLVSRHIPKFL